MKQQKTWLKCADPRKMLAHLGDGPSDRKLRLFSAACVRRAWAFAKDERLEPLLLLFEAIADGEIKEKRREPTRERCYKMTKAKVHDSEHCLAWEMWGGLRSAFVREDNDLGESAAAAFGYQAGKGAEFYTAKKAERVLQANLAREIFGTPFRPIKFDKKWRTDTVMTLARTMYKEREFSAAPILADALQDAGCNSDDLLNHLRDTGTTHYRGCWAVDLILGKK